MEINSVNAQLLTFGSSSAPELFYQIPNGEKEWHIVDDNDLDMEKILVPKNQTKDNWKEMIRVSAEIIPNYSLQQLFQEAVIQDKTPGFEYTLLEDTPNRILYEWKIPSGEDKGYGFTLIIKRDNTFYGLNYETIDLSCIQATRAKYLPMLEQAEIR